MVKNVAGPALSESRLMPSFQFSGYLLGFMRRLCLGKKQAMRSICPPIIASSQSLQGQIEMKEGRAEAKKVISPEDEDNS